MSFCSCVPSLHCHCIEWCRSSVRLRYSRWTRAAPPAMNNKWLCCTGGDPARRGTPTWQVWRSAFSNLSDGVSANVTAQAPRSPIRGVGIHLMPSHKTLQLAMHQLTKYKAQRFGDKAKISPIRSACMYTPSLHSICALRCMPLSHAVNHHCSSGTNQIMCIGGGRALAPFPLLAVLKPSHCPLSFLSKAKLDPDCTKLYRDQECYS